DAAPRFVHALTMRYRGQGHELRVALPPDLGAETAGQAAADAFAGAYRRTYGYVQDGAGVEIVDWSVTAHLPTDQEPHERPGAPAPALVTEGGARKGERLAYFPETAGYTACPVWDRYRLAPGAHVLGPAIVEERESTTVVPPGDELRVDGDGNLCITVGGER
ncbi:MAG: hydantoinase/oxoprolinase family protein, partial [Candidatus Dormibacteraeota bacterium]|nr:hydantoinase/oxoprolinase family protein [Candidatus Dormibacteraeota bacterium]